MPFDNWTKSSIPTDNIRAYLIIRLTGIIQNFQNIDILKKDNGTPLTINRFGTIFKPLYILIREKRDQSLRFVDL